MRCQIAVFKYEQHPSTAKNVAKYFAMNFSVVPETVASIIMAYYGLKSAAAAEIKKKAFSSTFVKMHTTAQTQRGIVAMAWKFVEGKHKNK